MAKTPKFINFSELDEDLKHFIQAGAKIFPIESYEALPTEKDKEFYRILSGEHKNEIYAWYESAGAYKLIGADDRYVEWSDIDLKPQIFPPAEHSHSYGELEGIPEAFPPSEHQHTENDITDLSKMWDEIEGKPEKFPPADHSHDELHEHENKSLLDSITQTLINSWNSAVGHISDAVKHITSEERILWNSVDDKVDKVEGKGLSTNDFTDLDKGKLDDLTEDAEFDYASMQQELNDHKEGTDHDNRYYTKNEVNASLQSKADKSIVDGHIQSTILHVTQTDKDNWNGKADKTYVDSEIENSGVKVVTEEPPDVKAGQVFFLEV